LGSVLSVAGSIALITDHCDDHQSLHMQAEIATSAAVMFARRCTTALGQS
jgi:hypothetical protein